MGMMTTNGRIAISTTSTGAKLLSVHAEASVRLNHGRVVVEIGSRMGAMYTVTSFPRP